MKAAAFTAPGPSGVIQLRDLPDPVCGPRDVLVRTRAIGLNFADIYRRRGEYGVAPPRPFVLGYEAAGVVEVVGAEVRQFKPGERVGFADVPRANAELVLCPEEKLVPLPESVSFEQAAALLLQGLTAHYLTHDSHAVTSGETVLVHSGGSGVGALVLQYCRRAGARSIAVVSNQEKAEEAGRSGASEVILMANGPWKNEAKERGTIDLIYDAVGSTLLESLEVVRTRGHVVFYGWAGGTPPLVDPKSLMNRSLRLSGGDLWNFIDRPDELRSRAAQVFSDFQEGVLNPRIDRCFPLSEAAAAHEYLEGRRARGKVLLIA